MRVIPFEAEHARRIELRDFDLLGAAGNAPQEFEAAMELYAVSGPAFTIEDEHGIVACGGVAIQPGRTGNAWMLTSREVDRIPIAVARAARRIIVEAERECGLNRIQTTVNVRHDPARKWFRFLGFRQESLMAHFYDEQDYYMYARVK